jgi:hypothetical protein
MVEIIVIPGEIDDAAFTGQSEQPVQDLSVDGRQKALFSGLPSVDDVPGQIEIVASDLIQESVESPCL